MTTDGSRCVCPLDDMPTAYDIFPNLQVFLARQNHQGRSIASDSYQQLRANLLRSMRDAGNYESNPGSQSTFGGAGHFKVCPGRRIWSTLLPGAHKHRGHRCFHTPSPRRRSALVSLKPIFDRLVELGYTEWGDDKLVVSGWPIQFLPAARPLEIEALDHAKEHELAPGLRTWVPGPEHLMAIALDLGRPKDKLRLEQFHRQKAYDPLMLDDILKRHQLEAKWRRISGLFDESPLV